MQNKIWISTGQSRFEKSWKNVELTWDQFIDKLKTPIRTPESFNEYLKADKDKQIEIKDVGGFVGGVISGGRRKVNSVTSRYIITLDIDEAPIAFWEDLTLMLDIEMVLYSTHKHSPKDPRYRLIMPLSREVLSDEYEAISRRIAGDIGIDLFDPTTFQPERLMYWPSAAKDGEYIFKHQKGTLIDSDIVLKRYTDWHDASQWPIAEKVKRKLKSIVDKQDDPMGKTGLVGIFCRLYPISEVILKYLTDVYEPTSYEDRYTFKHGSTSAGMQVHDDKFSFSHHSTDPTQGRLCNAFDLVRIHLFGDSDDRVNEKTPHNKRPSYGKMIELIVKDPEVKKSIVAERLDDKILLGLANEEDKQVIEAEEWVEKLDMDKKGNIFNTIANITMMLNNDKRLKDRLCWDDLRKCAIVKKDLPWRRIDKFSKMLVDSDDAEFRNYLEIMYGITYKDKIKDGIEIVVHQNSFHPIRDYLKKLVWDKRERLDKLLVDYLGAEDSVYVREVTRKTLVAAVARVFEPGIKFDHALVLVGRQGIGKSRLVSKLAGEWYSDTFGNMHNKDAMENLQGVWIMEIGELAGLKKQEVDSIKLFISKPEDRFRVAYGKRVESFPRQCIFIGTTNNEDFLTDPTGNRRFWPVKVGIRGEKERDGGMGILGKHDIEQIWAEACYVYTMGEDLWLSDELEMIAKGVQESHTERDELTGLIIDYLDTKIPKGWYELTVYERRAFLQGDETVGSKDLMERDTICVSEIWAELIGGNIRDMNKFNTKNIRVIMDKMEGWEKKLVNRKPYGTQRGWQRVGVMEILK